MMGQQALPRTRNNPPENEGERYQQHQSKKRRVDAKSQPPVVTVRQNRNTIPSSIRHHGASVSETIPSSSPRRRGKTLPTLIDKQQRQLSTVRQQEAAVSEESDGMSKDTTSQYPCRDSHDREILDTDQNVGLTASQVNQKKQTYG